MNAREALIGKGLRTEEAKIFYKHGWPKDTACKCCQISTPVDKCLEEMNCGLKRPGVAGRYYEKGKIC